MHIPDNYLSPTTCAILGAFMIPVWKKSIIKVKNEFSRKKMPILGICSAFSFLIMMFNIPLPGGTTGHAVGAALIAILIGPYAAILSTTIALTIQAFFFGDGGILALGANAFNMAFIMPVVAYYTYRSITGIFNHKKSESIAVFIAGYISLAVGALITAIEFGIQPQLFKDALGNPLYCPYGLNISIPAMVIPHLLVVCILEGAITVTIYQFIKKVSPELIDVKNNIPLKYGYGFILGLILLVPIGLIASGSAWGEWSVDEISNRLGYLPKGFLNGFNFNSIIPDYTIAGFTDVSGYIISAIIGVVLIFGAVKILEKSRIGQK